MSGGKEGLGKQAAGLVSAVISDITGFATVAGQKAMAASFPVVIASDQSTLTVIEEVVDAATGDVHVPAANVAAIVAYPATPTVYHILSGIAWSYDAVPVGGNITIVMNGSTVFDLDITQGGPGFFPFDPPKRCAVGDAVSVTLAAGGAGIQGKVSVLGHWTE